MQENFLNLWYDKNGDWMQTVGIICEYNPFHNGHIYHLEKIKEKFGDATIVLIMSGNFTEHSEVSILNKWEKTEIALTYGVDLVIELPFPFATQSADIFAKGAIQLLKALKVDYLVFGSESNNLETLEKLASASLNSDYQAKFKTLIKMGFNYPTALAKALYEITGENIQQPNDILALTYIKEIKKQKANIIPYSILRTNDFHNENLDDMIASATSIRQALKRKQDVQEYVPFKTFEFLNKDIYLLEDFFPFIKYQIITNQNNLTRFNLVDDSIAARINKYIDEVESLDDLILKVKTKKDTYHKIKRIMVFILTGFTKEEAKKNTNISYLRVLGFSAKGQKYLNKIKRELTIPLVTRFTKDNQALAIEMQVTKVYSLVYGSENIYYEYQKKPIIK